MYIKRSKTGEIEVLSQIALEGFTEALPEDAQDIKLFLTHVQSDNPNPLVSADMNLVRVLEDLIHLLTEKGIIQFTELPIAAQEKLLSKATLRSNLNKLDLISEDPDDETIHL